MIVKALVVVLLLADAVAGKLKTSLPEELHCSGCEQILKKVISQLKETSESTSSIELGRSLNDPAGYKKIPYSRSRVRITEVMDGVCEGLPSFYISRDMGEQTFVDRDMPEAEQKKLNVTKSNPHKKALDVTCQSYLEKYDEAATTFIYTNFEAVLQGTIDGTKEVCENIFKACDSSPEALEARRVAREEYRVKHLTWELEKVENDVAAAKRSLDTKEKLLDTRKHNLDSAERDVEAQTASLGRARDEADKAKAAHDAAVEKAAAESSILDVFKSGDPEQTKKVAELTSELAAAEEKWTKAQADKLTAASAETDASGKSSDLSAKLKEAVKRADAAEKAVERKEEAFRKLEQELRMARREAKAATEAREALETEDKDAQKARDDAKFKAEEASKESEKWQADVERLNKTLKEAQETPVDRSARLWAEEAARAANAQEELTKAEQRRDETKTRILTAESDVAAAQRKHEEEVRRRDAKKAELEALHGGNSAAAKEEL